MSNKLSIAFYVNGMAFNGDALEMQSLGGSETAGLCMAREMAARGHDVVMFCNTDKPGKYDGVNYLPISAFQGYMLFTAVDVLIAQRVPQVFQSQFKSKLNILWQHDLGLKRARGVFRGCLWNVDEIWGVSKFHVEQMAEVYKAPKGIFWATRNGVDFLKNEEWPERAAKRLMYSARPERGLDTLLHEIMPRLWAKDKDIELVVAGYNNTAPEMEGYYNSLHDKINEYSAAGRKVSWLGHLTKPELYREMRQATIYVYPTDFEEVSCITAMECMVNGLPFIGTKLAALPETLGDVAMLISGDAKTPEYQEKFVEAVMSHLSSEDVRRNMAERGVNRVRQLTWSSLAEEWEQHIEEMFIERTKNKEAMAEQFYRNEDIMALRALNPSLQWKLRVEAEYPFIENPELYVKTYVDGGAHYAEGVEKEGKMDLQTSLRFQTVMEIMAPRAPKRVLDYGGAYGNEAVQFVNAFGCDVTTVNVIPAEQELGKKYLLPQCAAPDKIDWKIEGFDPPKDDGVRHDVVFAGELLEHVWEPWKLADALEKRCTPEGLVIFTVPSGPWGDVDTELKHRGHLWSFERMDLKDMFHEKKNLSIKMVVAGYNEKNKETLGWYVISYAPGGGPSHPVNMGRKLKHQAPRQTVSACMIIGGKQEGLLHRCLTSVSKFADEILVLDTGMTPPCRDILAQYPKVRRIQSDVNPLTDGFDAARNASIAEAKGDWILWIDSDEELLGVPNAFKYLRHNMYDGYSIKQHHFSVQPPNAFKPDMPVRLFRNGRGVQFYGMVHEHPEKIMNESVGETTILSDVDIAHDGYLTEGVRRGRFDRNIGLMFKDREKYPDRELGKFLMMRDWMHLVSYTLGTTKGQITPEIVEWCENVITTYKENFLGKDSMMAQDGLGYYSEALKLMGRGLEYVYNFNVSSTDPRPEPEDKLARFETPEEFKLHVAGRLAVMIEPITGDYV